MRKILLGAALAAAIAITPAQAADLTNPTLNVERLKAADVAAFLTELGAGDVKVEKADGQEYVIFMNGQIPFGVDFIGCDGSGCLGLVLVVGFDFGATRYPLEMFNSFNKKYPFVSAVQLDGGKFLVSRMVVMEGGITRKNLATNISGFVAAPQAIMTFLNSQYVAGYRPNGAPPFQPVTMNNGLMRPIRLTRAEMDQVGKELPAMGIKLRR
jgi:Putative bacterial sensory transduction regulator